MCESYLNGECRVARLLEYSMCINYQTNTIPPPYVLNKIVNTYNFAFIYLHLYFFKYDLDVN